MSEEFLERLSRFTPAAGGLNRDALLFAAGRSSARPNRAWKTLAALLAGTQALSLVLLWPRPTPPAGGFAVPVVAVLEPPSTLEPPIAETRPKPGVWSARHSLLASGAVDYPKGDVTFIDSGPPLRASSLLRQSLRN
jgi:hypothetical protein